MIRPEHWGKGAGGRVAAMLMAKAATEPALRRIVALIDPTHEASRRILIRNGFVSRTLGTFDGLPGELLERRLALNTST